MNIKNLFFTIPWLFVLSIAVGQTKIDSAMVRHEAHLVRLCSRLFEVRFNDKLQDSLNNQLKTSLKQVLEVENSMDYHFDSLKQIGKVTSNDGLVRIFTYNIVRENGEYWQTGFLQYYSKNEKKTYLYELIDQKHNQAELENASLNPDQWYGALYYQIIENKFNGEKLYTLLGLDGNNLYSNKKVIDVLYFTTSEKPKFGKPIFVVGKKKQKRLVFEYSRMVSMLVKFDARYDMIILDHLAPESSIYLGDFKHYGPDLSYDGLKFTEGFWQFIPNIDYKAEKQRGR